MLKEKLPLVLINILLLHNPILALTADRQNYRQRNDLILVGLGNLWFLQVKPVVLYCTNLRSILSRKFLLYVILCRIVPGPKPPSAT